MGHKTKRGFIACGIIIALLAVGVAYQYNMVKQYENRIAMDYRRAFSDAADYIGDMDYDITKALLISSPAAFTNMAEDIWRLSNLASEEIGRLPVTETELDNAEKYLAQSGEFALTLARKTAKGESITEEERQQLVNLGKYASKLNETLHQAETDIYTNTFTREQLLAHGNSYLAASSAALTENLVGAEDSMADYPSLIYDGPFSEHIQSAKPKMIANSQEVTQKEAQMRAVAFFGDENVDNVKLQGEFGDGIKAYSFVVDRGDDQSVTVEVTKKGGYLLSVINNRIPRERICSVEEAVESGRSFLKSQGIGDVKESYYRYEGNNLIINYSCTQDGWVLYPDLLKVVVAMDNCEITGYEATGYIMNHSLRQPPVQIISEEQVRERIAKDVLISTISKALIPLDGGREVFCYEVKGKFMDKQVIIYLNAQTGEEENILILLDTPDGTLTV